MPENRDCGRKNLSQMSTEELEQILRQDVEAPADQEADTDFLLDVMEVLAKRDKENVQTKKAAEEAWASFQEHYAPEPEAIRSAKPARPWLRHLVAAAAALVLILSIPLTARALGWDELWDVVARWAKETFSFVSGDPEQVSEPSPTYDGEYTSLQDLLKRSNRPYDMVPTWVPDGFVLEKVEKDVTPEQEVYQALYKNGSREVKLNFKTFTYGNSWNVEIEDSIEIQRESGIEYYIFSNLDKIQVIWIDESYECMISGDISLEEAKQMINSIKKG